MITKKHAKLGEDFATLTRKRTPEDWPCARPTPKRRGLVARWLGRWVRGTPPTLGRLKNLKARRHKDGRVEIFAPRSNPEHSLWLEAHKDHWPNFIPNTQRETPTHG